MTSKLFVSVDVDEWYLTRWASGSEKSLWRNLPDLFEAVYGKSSPAGEIEKPVAVILELFDELGFTSTFFITGLIASYYPEMVREIARRGHEVAAHNYNHIDYADVPEHAFLSDLKRCKHLLEDLSGREVIGYRSPNSSIPTYLARVLTENGFKYDSSVTPTRKLMGKFGDFVNAPTAPYFVETGNIGEPGDSGLLEIPWSVFPAIRTPAGSGITHRLFGERYNRAATKYSLSRGCSSYYFHPYEIDECIYYRRIDSKRIPLKAKFFMRNVGPKYLASLKRFLGDHQSQLINGESLHARFAQSGQARTSTRRE